MMRVMNRPWRPSRLVAFVFTLLIALFVLLAGPAFARAQEHSMRLLDAREQGTFNLGAAKATLSRPFDPAIEGEVLRLDYSVPPGTTAGVWAKAFPEAVNAGNTDVLRVGVRSEDRTEEPLRQIAAAVEIKGSAGVQRIPLKLQPGRNICEETIHWQTVGTLNEVVIAVNRIGSGEPATGTLDFELSFGQLPWARKLSMSPVGTMGGVLLVSLVLATLSVLPYSLSSRRRLGLVKTSRGLVRRASAAMIWLGGLKRDFVCGAALVFIAGLAIGTYALGQMSRLETGWTALGIALAGAAVAEWLKFGLTGKHLTPAEIFQDLLASGLLAASSSSLVVLQAPAAWSEVLMLSSTVAAVTLFLYHAANAYRLAFSDRHLGPINGVLIVAAPYLVGGLLLLGSLPLMTALGGVLTAGTLADWPTVHAAVGRVLVVFLFNEAVGNGIGLATKRSPVKSLKAHLVFLAVAVAVVAAPWIADWGSGTAVAAWPAGIRFLAVLAATVLSQAGLWAEVYLITGMAMDGLHGKAPSQGSAVKAPFQGMKKGMVFSGVFIGLLYGLDLIWKAPVIQWLAAHTPLALAAISGAIVFPLAKTIMETFDGSQRFFRRVRASYRNPVLYARGVVVGLGLGYAIGQTLSAQETLNRVGFGFGVGVAAFAGISLLRDCLYGLRGRGRPLAWRAYLVEAVFGGLIGAGLGFYLDAAQVSVVVAKFHRYLSVGVAPEAYGVYPLLSKWGFISLGSVTGGVSLLFAEALAGLISWAVPAWLFALNAMVMAAYFRKDPTPIKSLFTPEGFAGLMQNMLAVLRWGLWMSPIINSFLRPMGQPTWYNQDGAVRTVIAIFRDATLGPEAFHAWSLQVFVALLAYDVVRVLIWLDHMGLRVATLVNLSFLGMDKLDQRLARFLGPAASASCIPESVKRFATWAPLLIPFYIPMGRDWDVAWNESQSLIAAQGGGLLATIRGLSLSQDLLLLAGATAASTAVFATTRWLRNRLGSQARVWTLRNSDYEVVVKENGEALSRLPERNYDVSRRSYDFLDPAGRAVFLVDATREVGDPARTWPILGNFLQERAPRPEIEQSEGSLVLTSTHNGVRATIEITLPIETDPAELWTITLENLTDAERQIKVAPYLEWVLNRPRTDRGHTQYNRLFAEMEYSSGLNAVLAWDKHSKAQGLLAADTSPEGFLSSRVDFIGRARSLWRPRALETLAFSKAGDTESHPTFDPIGSLLLGTTLEPQGSAQVRLLIGQTKNKKRAIELIARHLRIPGAREVSKARKHKAIRRIGHGEIPPGTPQPYFEYEDGGRTLLVRTPFTPRPYDHTLANRRGHVVVVTNRGLHTTSSWNSQQNRVTPDWSDTVTREVPGEAFYLYDPDSHEWYSPTYHPLNDAAAAHEVEFSVDGSATYRMTRGTLSTDLKVFVPPEEPVGVYLLTVRNEGETARRLRLAPYFQIVLADQPEHSGPLKVRHEKALNAVFFENPRNVFRTGPAFVAMSLRPECVETKRGRFFGSGCGVARPFLVEQGEPDGAPTEDDRTIAGMLTTLEIPAQGECTVAVVLGQADSWPEAKAVIRRYLDPEIARVSLEDTRQWWLRLMSTVQVQTSSPAFDHYLDWLKYQAIAERLWARRGFYQASGAFGFRDQLQDSVNLIWVDPAFARRQILLHASQQFLEGDVVHWFHQLQDGRTGFAGRTHASDNLLWLAWAVAEYVGATGDDSILDERTPYLEAEQPFEPLPGGKEGMGFNPLRSSRADTVYGHCMRSIDLVLDKRMGAHGLPLIGTGDWNDGLDEIGSEGKGESIWLGFFLYYILDRMVGMVERKEGRARKEHYVQKARQLKDALEGTWRGDRYLRAIHDDGTEIGVEGSGVWEIDALTAAWAVMSGINPERGRTVFDTALRVLEKENVILLGWPALREDTEPYLGRSSRYPEGVRENGMYCHGVQWLVGAARLLAEQCQRDGDLDQAREYRQTAYRLWRKTSALSHVGPEEIETYGGQPNKQAADLLTTFDPGRMIWNGYTGAAGWVFRQAIEGVLGARLVCDELVPPDDAAPIEELGRARVRRRQRKEDALVPKPELRNERARG